MPLKISNSLNKALLRPGYLLKEPVGIKVRVILSSGLELKKNTFLRHGTVNFSWYSSARSIHNTFLNIIDLPLVYQFSHSVVILQTEKQPPGSEGLKTKCIGMHS